MHCNQLCEFCVIAEKEKANRRINCIVNSSLALFAWSIVESNKAMGIKLEFHMHLQSVRIVVM